MLGHDTYLSGDGMVGAFRFEDGHVDYQQRYVRTERFLAERRARRSLLRAVPQPVHRRRERAVQASIAARRTRRRSGTAGGCWRRRRTACPWEVDPFTLETVGRYDYDGRLDAA